jgi:hypothetical protein
MTEEENDHLSETPSNPVWGETGSLEFREQGESV